MADSKIVWEWRNDEVTRKMSFDTNQVPWETHAAWYERSLQNPHRKMFIFETSDVPVSVVRLDIDGSSAEISINVSPNQRGKGYGKLSIDACVKIGREMGLKKLIAQIKTENTASIVAFGKMGFNNNRLLGDHSYDPSPTINGIVMELDL